MREPVERGRKDNLSSRLVGGARREKATSKRESFRWDDMHFTKGGVNQEKGARHFNSSSAAEKKMV